MNNKAGIAAVLMVLASVSGAKELTEFEFDPRTQAAQHDGAPVVCAIENWKAPEGLVVYAAGAYSGRQAGFQIDQSGHQATQFDIAVNTPNRPVALMLGAYEPTIWNIGWSANTQIVAVVVSGHHRQVVAGLEAQVPVLNSSQDNRGPCGYFYIGQNQNAALNPLARQLFGQPVELVYQGDDTGRILVGEPLAAASKLVTSTERPPESFRDPLAPLAGKAGIDAAVAKGVLRRATVADANAWASAKAESAPGRDVPPIAGAGVPLPAAPGIRNAYVVLNAFTYPSGLFGAHAASFFIPNGVLAPSGNPGHSAVYDFNSLQCRGALCR